MRRLPILLLSLSLLGAGCFSSVSTGTETVPAPEPGMSAPPAIEMSVQGKAVTGVEGSYCYGPTCVDKIPPVQLVAETGVGFSAVSKSNVSFTSTADVKAMSISVLDSSGAAVGSASSDLTQDASGSFTYSLPASLKSGNYYLLVMAQFSAGGDVSYIFPVSIK